MLSPGEAPDAYLADLSQLALTVCGDKGENKIVDCFVIFQFVKGSPEPTRSQVRALTNGGKWELGEVLEAAKSILWQMDLQASGGFFSQAVEMNRKNGVGYG